MRKIGVFLIIVLLFNLIPTPPLLAAADTDYTPQAQTLKQLGLFLGTSSGFELNRAATRAEAAVMTVRLLGKEAEATDRNFTHPFTDVPGWAAPYVGYLYNNKITTGISDSLYGSTQTATSAQFATFVLRALGYDDKIGDFTWDKSLDKMASLGILTETQATDFSLKELRGYIVAISHLSLFANLKGSSISLLEKLYFEDNAITATQLKAASGLDSRVSMFSNVFGIPKQYPAGEALNSEEIFAKVSDAVFKIETKILTESDFGTGSGFFITSDGIAVTNLHVISFMSSATIITTNGRAYPVEGILAINADADLAIIKVKGTGFPYLELGDPVALRTAQRIYCVGSPYGFDNSISDGLISNVSREYEGHKYIQISAPIAPGSSGGALLNEYGQVVGVTTSGFEQGAVNLAAKITDLSNAFRFPKMRSVKYLQAHSHFGAIPITDKTYTRNESADANKPTQTMRNDSVMYGTIKSAGDVHYYSLDVKGTAEILVSLTSNERTSGALKFEVSDPSGKVVLESQHYKGEIFSIATGLGAAKGLYTVKIYVEDGGLDWSDVDWSDVDYELFWLYHETFEDSEAEMIFFEFEPNDTLDHANYIPDMFTYYSSISTKNDVDYYKFTLASNAEYSAVIMSDHPGSVFNAEVFDSDNKSIGKFTYGYAGESFEKTLPAGTYYIKVTVKDTSIQWNNDSYVISGFYL